MKKVIGGLLLTVIACSGHGGGTEAVCTKTVDLSAKQGNCAGLDVAPLLGASSSCSMRVSACSASDKTTLDQTLDCLAALPTCEFGKRTDWVTAQATCYDKVKAVTDTCKSSVWNNVLPGTDAGVDAGPPPDAGRQPIDDGGAGISFVAVANEHTFAFAWVPLQPAGIASWELNVFDTTNPGNALRLPEVGISGGATRTFELDGGEPGVMRRFYLAGIDAMSMLAYGVVEDAGMAADAGNCTTHAQCPVQQVCDLGTCKSQVCTMTSTCPQPDYICNVNITPHTCLRTGGSMGGIDAGTGGGGPNDRLPMISAAVNVRTGLPMYSETFIGGFAARRPDVVAIDSARQFVAMEQGGEPVGHSTISRGNDFSVDQQSASIIDTVGTNVKVAWNPDNKVIYACYQVGVGVRVRASHDYGKTWGEGALTVAPDDDGGNTSSISDCDIAAWSNGNALIVTVDDGYLVTRQVTEGLALLGSPDIAFVPSPADGGGYNIFNVQRPSIATLPSANLVHIGFTGHRLIGALTDSDIYGVHRDSTTAGVFSMPEFIDAPGTTGMGSSFPQDYVNLAIDPVTKRAIAAWSSLEDTGFGSYSTVYLAMFPTPTGQRRWITGADLSVFINVQASYPLFPARSTGLWDAFSPALAVTRDGRIWLSMLAGQRMSTGANEIFPYAVEFGLDAGSPVGGQGWFKPPAAKMSSTHAADPRSGGNAVPATNSALAADSQISLYGTFIEGIGTLNSEENRGVFVTRP